MRPKNTRSGFTLVEIMVAMALTVFVMLILSQCFVQGLETFSGLKAIGDMQEELRTATNLLRADLSMDHFEGKRRLSDPFNNFMSEKIREGFFVVGGSYPGKAPTEIVEGQEDQIPSIRATDHWLHFSVKMRGNAMDKFFSAPADAKLAGLINNYMGVPGDSAFQRLSATNTNVNSAWAEVAYCLIQTGTTASPSGATLSGSDTSTPLYALYRFQYVVLPMTRNANNASLPAGGPYRNFSGNVAGAAWQFFSPNDLANGYASRAFVPYTALPFAKGTAAPAPGALVLSNVVSFQIQVLKNPNPNPPPANSGLGPNVNNDFVDITGLTATNGKPIPFDTANYYVDPRVNPNGNPLPVFGAGVTAPPPQFSIQALRITLRIWDPKSRFTRQVTVIQDM